MNGILISFNDSIKENRHFYYGISILLVILSHLNAFGYKCNIFDYFYVGNIGVDIFMFFSAFGCCYSYESNTLFEFYKRRVKRIYPIYALFAILVSVLHLTFGVGPYTVWGGVGLSPFDWFCNLTLLWYFKIGGIYIHWYMFAILFLYAFHPMFYHLAKRTGSLGFALVTTITIILLAQNLGFEDWHKMLIGRIPMYYAGCLIFFSQRKLKESGMPIKLYFVFAMTLVMALFFVILNNVRGYIIQDMCAPFLMFAIFIFANLVQGHVITTFVESCGKYSYQIFVGNALAMHILYIIMIGFTISYIMYIILTVVFSVIFVCYENRVKRIKYI